MKLAPSFALVLVGCIENELSAPDDFDRPPVSEPGSTPVDEVPPPVVPCVDLQTLTVDLEFPARQDCPWGLDDNLTQQNELNRARVEEVRDLVLPDGAQLCDLAIHSRTDDLLFDDHVTLTLDDVVLIGGGYGYAIDVLGVSANLPRYRWDDVVDLPFRDRDAPYYCIGEPDSACVLPQTEVAGPLDLALSEAATEDLVAAMSGKTTLPFRVITFGDDDEDDCAHTDLILEVEVSYTLR